MSNGSIKIYNRFLVGPVAALQYVATVVLGGYFWSDYSVYQAISRLTLPDAPHRTAILTSLVIFNLLLFLHGLIIIYSFQNNSWLQLAGILYLVAAIAGLVMCYYPMDPSRVVHTFSGTVHRWMATIAIVGAATITLLSSIGFYVTKSLRRLARTSFYFSGLVLASALAVWICALNASAWFGVFQKISMGLFMLWIGWSTLLIRRQTGCGAAAER